MPTADAKGLKRAASYDPDSGVSDPREADPTNRIGSGLLLAMLLPARFGAPGTAPLRCFGYPAEDSLLQLSANARPRSGAGPDNRRMNVLEACLNHWYGDASRVEVRDQLQLTLCTLVGAVDNSDPDRRQPVWNVMRPALQTRYDPAVGQRERRLNGHMT